MNDFIVSLSDPLFQIGLIFQTLRPAGFKGAVELSYMYLFLLHCAIYESKSKSNGTLKKRAHLL
jgi:hypothetical protein